MIKLAILVVAGLLTWLPATSEALIIQIVDLKSLPRSAPNNVNSTDDLIPIFGSSNVADALASIQASLQQINDLQIEVTEGGGLGSLDGAKDFDLHIAADEFVTIKFATKVALIVNDPAGSPSTQEIRGLPNGLSNIRRWSTIVVPEPSALALFLATSVLAIGSALRRRL